jgi:hypothetical protein
MRAFLVDPKTQTVDEVDFDGSQAQLCYLLGLQIVPVGNPGIRGCSAALDMHSETRLFLYGKGRRHLYALARVVLRRRKTPDGFGTDHPRTGQGEYEWAIVFALAGDLAEAIFRGETGSYRDALMFAAGYCGMAGKDTDERGIASDIDQFEALRDDLWKLERGSLARPAQRTFTLLRRHWAPSRPWRPSCCGPNASMAPTSS